MTSKKNDKTSKKTANKTAGNVTRKDLISRASDLGVDAQIITSFETGDLSIKEFTDICQNMTDISKKSTDKVDKVDKDKKEQVKNLLGGELKKSRAKGSKSYGKFAITFNLKSGDKITQSLSVDSFVSDSEHETIKVYNLKKLQKIINIDIRYHTLEHRLYFYPNGAYDINGDLPEQVGYWLTSLSMVPDIDLINTCSIEQVA